MPSISIALIAGMFSIVRHQGLVGMEGMWVGVEGGNLPRVTVVDWLQKTYFFPASAIQVPHHHAVLSPWLVGWWPASFLDSGFRTLSSSLLDKRKLKASPDISKSLCPFGFPSSFSAIAMKAWPGQPARVRDMLPRARLPQLSCLRPSKTSWQLADPKLQLTTDAWMSPAETRRAAQLPYRTENNNKYHSKPLCLGVICGNQWLRHSWLWI